MKIDTAALQERLRDLQEHFDRAASQNRADGLLPYAASLFSAAIGQRLTYKELIA
jgi:hypothetical protein